MTPSSLDERMQRMAGRATRLLAQPGAFLIKAGPIYELRVLSDARRRPVMRLDEAVFRRLVKSPGLRPIGQERWVKRESSMRDPAAPEPGRPGIILGDRAVTEPDGAISVKRANVSQSAVSWLARRRGSSGSAWLTPEEVAAGEKLTQDFELGGIVGHLTMIWDAAPLGFRGRGPGVDPAERGRSAKQRVASALAAVDPECRSMLDRVCLRGSALQAAENGLGLKTRSGKILLKRGLRQLAQHYGFLS